MKRMSGIWVVACVLCAGLVANGTASTALCGAWGFVPAPLPSTGPSTLLDVGALSATDAWAVGYSAGTQQTLAQHWDGTSWTIVPTPSPSTILQVNSLTGVAAISSTDVWAVGIYAPDDGPGPAAQTLALHWDGSTWSVVPSPVFTGGSQFDGVSALASDDIWAVGVRALGAPGPDETPLTARWDGSTWQVVTAPYVADHINRFYGVSARTASDAWAVGEWRSLTSTFHIMIEHWDGSSWSVVSAPDPGDNDQLSTVLALAADDAWIVGSRHDGPTQTQQALIMHWNGTDWSVYPLALSLDEFNRLNAIEAISPTDIWAAGAHAAVAGGPSEPLLMHWDGTDWTTVPAGATDGTAEYFDGIAVVGQCDVWAVGSYSKDSETAPLTERLTAPVALTATNGLTPGPSLAQNVPNPFNPTTTIDFTLPVREHATVAIYDASGRMVRLLLDDTQGPGAHEVVWDGRDGAGSTVSSGVYFYRLTAGGRSQSRKMLLLK